MNKTNLRSKIWHYIKRSAQIVTALVLVTLLAAFITETVRRNVDERNYPAPGQLVDIGTHKMHLWCKGNAGNENSPTIILDSGAGVFSTSWRYVIEDLAVHNRTCAFDRSGLGWSEPGPGSYDGLQASLELKTLLEQAGLEPPFVYVGHSLGAMLGQIYHHQYPDDLSGLVMIEPADPEILISEIGEDRGHPVERNAEIKPCGLRCPIAMTAASLGVVRIALGMVDAVNDPLFHAQSLAEFKARVSRPESVRFAMYRGRFIPTIAFQTGDLKSFGNLPVMMVYGTKSGSLLGDSESPEDLEIDQRAMRAAWNRNSQRSANNLGLRAIEGANHLSVVTYQQYAKRVAEAVLETVAAGQLRGQSVAKLQ